jgi:hypothetical protein
MKMSSRRPYGAFMKALLAAGMALLSAGCFTREEASRRVVRCHDAEGVLFAPDPASLQRALESPAKMLAAVVRLPCGTKGRIVGEWFLEGGTLVKPYPANDIDMNRDGITEVVLFEVTEGPFRQSRGWALSRGLWPDFSYL